MAQGMDDVEEARTSRQLDSVLETVGMDCNPGYGRDPEMPFSRITHIALRVDFFFRADSLRNAVPSRRRARRRRSASRPYNDAFYDS